MAYDTYTDSRGTQITNYGYMQYIWTYFHNRGLPYDAIAALMGNLYAESMCVPYIVQGNTSYPFSYSVNYTNNVTSGVISEYDFVHNGPNGGGYGLAQWTWYTRKQGLYDMFVNEGYTSIGDKTLACKYLWTELNTNFTNVWSYLMGTGTSLFNKTKYVLFNFENPADKSTAVQNKRYAYACAIYEYLYGTAVVDPPDDESGTGGGSGGGGEKPSGFIRKLTKDRNISLFMHRHYYDSKTHKFVK